MFAGEKIELFLIGDEEYCLDDIQFSVFVYPDGDLDPRQKYTKADCERQEDGSYLLTIGSEETIAMALSSYTVEIYDSSNEMIFLQRNVFQLLPSATQKDLTDEGGD